MFIDVAFTHAEIGPEVRDMFHFIAVVDVLRATTTITAALENGARGVVPAATPEDARLRAEELQRAAEERAAEGPQSDPAGSRALLGGERHARIIPGFDLGNSPLEYTADVVKDKIVVLTTTNGTRAFHRVQAKSPVDSGGASLAGGVGSTDAEGSDGFGLVGARPPGTEPVIVAACLRNARAVARAALRAFGGSGGAFSVLIVCAGTDGRFSWDDAYCAGVIVTELMQLMEFQGRAGLSEGRTGSEEGRTDPAEALRPTGAAQPEASTTLHLGDGARAALNMIAGLRSRSDVGEHSDGGHSVWPHSREQLAASRHGRRLLAMGLEEDVRFCAETNRSAVVPRLNLGMLIWEPLE